MLTLTMCVWKKDFTEVHGKLVSYSFIIC